jgi:hypothetical protein
MEFASDNEMQKIPRLTQEFFEHVLYDEEPLFISDEATIWDVSVNTAEELIRRCSEYYQKPVSAADLRQPLWKLIRQLNEGRNVLTSAHDRQRLLQS